MAQYDEPKIAALAATVDALAQGFYWLRKEAYAVHAAALVRAWFVTNSTAMNPNLNFGQSFPGVIPNGSFSGLIEMDGNLVTILDGVALLAAAAPCGPHGETCPGSTAWTGEDQTSLLQWLSRWSAWLASSPFSSQALSFFNNHNTWGRASWFTAAAWVGEFSICSTLLRGAMEGENAPIGEQIWRDGELPAECARVNSIGYTIMDLTGLFTLCQGSVYPPFVAATQAAPLPNLYHFVAPRNQSSVRTATDFTLPFAAGKKKWPFPSETIDFRDAFSLYRQAGSVYRNKTYWEVAALLPGNSSSDAGLLWWG